MFPDEIAELVPDFLPYVPIDNMNGSSLKYRKTDDGGFDLWSVGLNLSDDDCNAGESSVRYRHWTTSSDIVWPRAATRDEVERHLAAERALR